MHRIDYDGYTTESGARRFIDQSNPGVPGTVMGAQFFNAVQEEMIAIVLFAGLTPSASASADRSAGWHQVRDAIFSSGKIDTPALADGAVENAKIADGAVGASKISSVDLSTAVGALTIYDATTDPTLATTWTESPTRGSRSSITIATGSTQDIIQDTTTGRQTHRHYKGGSGGFNLATQVVPEGIQYFEDAFNAGSTYTVPLKQATVEVALTGWTEEAPGQWIKTVTTNIPKTRRIWDAKGMGKTPHSVQYDGDHYKVVMLNDFPTRPFSAITFNRYSTSAYWEISVLYIGADPLAFTFTGLSLLVTYSGE